MGIDLEAPERDALHASIRADLSLFGDFEDALARGEVNTCADLGRTLADGLRLLVDGALGWRLETTRPTVFSLCAEDLLPIMLRKTSTVQAEIEALENRDETLRGRLDDEAATELAELRLLNAACESVINQARRDLGGSTALRRPSVPLPDVAYPWDRLVPRFLHPIKVIIIEAMLWVGKPLAAKQVEFIMDDGTSVGIISYHMRALASVQVVRKVDHKKIRGATQTFYELAALNNGELEQKGEGRLEGGRRTPISEHGNGGVNSGSGRLGR